MNQDPHSNALGAGKAVVTGASSGIGAVYARRLAERGYDLLLVARDGAKLAAMAANIQAATGRRAEIMTADLTLPAGQRQLEARLASDDAITMLVNNAGVGATAAMVDSDVDSLDAMIQLNVVALTRLTRAIAPRFVARGGGIIINIASIVAIAPEVLNGTYGGTKAFVLALTQSLHKELSERGVQVQVVLPGATRTSFWQAAGVPVEHLPQEIVMGAEEMVDAALVGLDRKELVTIPALPDVRDWESFESARRALGPNLSLSKPAARYATESTAGS
ncbi:MAG TPA: SDR family oxidoreductase [Ramlibacter sp.]|nr:SDR family oxidoreductase [Ramlibacter sp.]